MQLLSSLQRGVDKSGSIVTTDAFEPTWFEPFSGSVQSVAPAEVAVEKLLAAGAPALAEPLVAQRVATVGQKGIVLSEAEGESSLARWGTHFSSAVAALQALPDSMADPKRRRERRKYQELLLLEQSRWPDLASVRSTAFILCADHKPPEYGLPRQLYSRQTPDSLLSWESFGPLLDQFISAVSPAEAPTWEAAGSMLREALTTIVYETFKNTHDHARSEVTGADVQTSVRGLYSRFYPINAVESALATLRLPTATPADRYLASFVQREPKPGVRIFPRPAVGGFLEISVFDSGPGMAARWIGKRKDFADGRSQLEAVLSCFQKGRTTTGSNGRGFGLWKVLMSLEQLRGFISVRTNSIHAYRQFGFAFDLVSTETTDGARVPKEQLLDWKRGLSTVPSNYPEVKGTVVSFLIPMGGA
ncbi:hypothetical protein [Burkholderia metallica]|uniref:hypothetical protein n=1 Tax=Burkholderia metallica TaxID=488729 RepID=UPI00131DC4BF|nr:hypothetical protein [Burkholderia metallica]